MPNFNIVVMFTRILLCFDNFKFVNYTINNKSQFNK